ncbi:PfkB family carbohydrate kinase [Rubellimicrobium aerolatum]|uniref:PfkB family carbohydrate kinase n=1 Tax=Rubellimicrobium aerolatum TaxID=490979 RepID=A0ABW0S8A4_9RHOB|nr:PfkB family carbohydrate kinase [Rubellimicrobium aerolatum]MBP1804291.1 sugar/nucleoside kinase (ribokinase family) [Rubellimicrobium aerolatum]
MTPAPDTPVPDILCIGSVLWDIIGRTPSHLRLGADVPGRIVRIPGGVAMNIAMTLRRFGLRPALLTAIGRDPEGEQLVAEAARMGLLTGFAYRSEDLPTDRYMAVEGGNGLVAAIADAHSLEAAGDRILRPLEDGRLGTPAAPWPGPIVLDGNLTADLLARIAASPLVSRADLRLAPASPGKAERLLPLLGHPGATIYVNLEEARILGHRDFQTSAEAARGLVERGARRVIVTDGARSVSDADRDGLLTLQPPAVLVTRVTGAGDTFLAAHLTAEREGAPREAALARALHAAALYVSGDTPT